MRLIKHCGFVLLCTPAVSHLQEILLLIVLPFNFMLKFPLRKAMELVALLTVVRYLYQNKTNTDKSDRVRAL